MNLTHKILEGIHDAEDEFEINPELLKKQPGSQAFSRARMAEAFIANGWTMSDSHSNMDGSSTYVFTNDGFPDVRVAMRAKNQTHIVFKRMVLFMPGNKFGNHTPATPDNVVVITKMIKDHFAEFEGVEGGDSNVVYDELKAVGWNIVASAGPSAVLYEHPVVKNQIKIKSDADSNKIVKVVITHPGGSDEYVSTDVASIVKRAQELVAPGGVGKKKSFEIDELKHMLGQIGWKIVKIGVSTFPDVSSVFFKHPKIPYVMHIMYNHTDGQLREFILEHGAKMILHVGSPTTGFVYKKVQELMISEGL